jgi:hypothetical protein
MSITTGNLTTWNRISLSLGTLAWVVIVLINVLGWIRLDDLKLILLLALWVITPLAVPLTRPPKERQQPRSLSRLILFLQPFAALSGGLSFLLGTGLLAASAAGLWFLFTGLIALLGLARLRGMGNISLAHVCLAIALIYLPIGGLWFVIARLGAQPLGFSQQTILLTAIHFHYIALAGLIITGLLGQVLQTTQRAVPLALYRFAASGMLLNPLLVAAGITFTQVTGEDVLESVAATLLALSLILVALLNLRFIIPSTTAPLAKGLLLVSSTAVFFTMLAAFAYAFGAATGVWSITIAQMIAVHGWTNALAFGLCGLIGWRLRARQENW